MDLKKKNMKKSKKTFADLFGIDNRKLWEKEWQDMPEFVSENRKDYAEIIVRFRNKKDLKKFASLISQNLSERTKSIYYPILIPFQRTKHKYINES